MLLQIPGGPELLIVLLLFLFLFGPVVAVVVFLLQRTQDGDDAEVAELKARVDELEAQIAAGDKAANNEVSVEDQRADEDDR